MQTVKKGPGGVSKTPVKGLGGPGHPHLKALPLPLDTLAGLLLGTWICCLDTD